MKMFSLWLKIFEKHKFHMQLIAFRSGDI